MWLTSLPLSQTVTLSRTSSPLERDVLYGRPLSSKVISNEHLYYSIIIYMYMYICYILRCKYGQVCIMRTVYAACS